MNVPSVNDLYRTVAVHRKRKNIGSRQGKQKVAVRSRDKNVINDGRSAGEDITNYDRGGVLRLDSGGGSNFRDANRKFGEREYKRNNGAFPRGCKSAGIYRAAAQRHDKWAAVHPGELFDERFERPLLLLLLLLNPR